MARTARKQATSETYHVVLRGFNRQKIFFDNADRKAFLERLKNYKDLDRHKIFAYTLTDMSAHLIIQEGVLSISRLMQKLQTSFVYYYNKKYKREGSVFQDRFSSEPLENDLAVLSAMRFIHQRIIIEHSEHQASPLWTSYSSFLNDDPYLINIELLADSFKTKDNYCKFMNITEVHKFLEPNLPNISDGRVYLEISQRLKSYEAETLKELSKKDQKTVLKKVLEVNGVGLRQLSRVAGVGLTVIRGLKDNLETPKKAGTPLNIVIPKSDNLEEPESGFQQNMVNALL